MAVVPDDGVLDEKRFQFGVMETVNFLPTVNFHKGLCNLLIIKAEFERAVGIIDPM